jgi:hypothetical protein
VRSWRVRLHQPARLQQQRIDVPGIPKLFVDDVDVAADGVCLRTAEIGDPVATSWSTETTRRRIRTEAGAGSPAQSRPTSRHFLKESTGNVFSGPGPHAAHRGPWCGPASVVLRSEWNLSTDWPESSWRDIVSLGGPDEGFRIWLCKAMYSFITAMSSGRLRNTPLRETRHCASVRWDLAVEALDVESQQGVPIETESADGRTAAQS